MDERLRPMRSLLEAYRQPRELAFKATNEKQWRLWQEALRAKVAELTGVYAWQEAAPEVEVIEREDKGSYVREFIEFTSAEDVRVPAYILLPKDEKEHPAAIALHGHGYGVDDIVGIREDGSERNAPEGYHKDFALELVKRGLVVVAPEIACFGRRREEEDIAQGSRQSSCRKPSLFAMLLGRTILGLRMWDTMKVIDYLETRPEVDASRIGCMGISGGGMLALFTAALDERIKALVVSGYLNTFLDSIVSIRHCECNYVPGLLKYAEMYDLAALVAPRPLLAESGTKDAIFPIEAARHSFEKVKTAYELLDVPERIDIDIFEGDHQISGREAYDWLAQWLT